MQLWPDDDISDQSANVQRYLAPLLSAMSLIRTRVSHIILCKKHLKLDDLITPSEHQFEAPSPEPHPYYS